MAMTLLQRTIENLKRHYQHKKLRGIMELILAVLMLKFPWSFIHIGKKKVLCPICSWEGPRFLPFRSSYYITFNVHCPQCDSRPRHRGHYYYYTTIWEFEKLNGDLLFVAPAKSILDLFLTNPNLSIKTADLFMEDVDYTFDIVDIPLEDGMFDYIICHHVIEHTSDDRKAIRELIRLLKPNGELVFSVPIDVNQQKTVEFGEPNPVEDFHYYHYGLDFDSRIPKGMEVKKTIFKDIIPMESVDRIRLDPMDRIYHLKKPGI